MRWPAPCASCRTPISSCPAPTRSTLRLPARADPRRPLRGHRPAAAAPPARAGGAGRGGPRLPRRVHLGALRAGGVAPASPTSTRSPPRARPPRCRPTARRSSSTAGRCATCLPSSRRWTGPRCSPRSATRPRPPTTTRPPPQAYRTAHELATGAGDVRAAAALAPRMAAVAHLLGEGLDARVGRAAGGAGRAWTGWPAPSASGPGCAPRWPLPTCWTDRLDEAITHGERSRAESQLTGDDETAAQRRRTLGSVLVFAGRMDEGWQLLEDAMARARAAPAGGGGGARIPDDRIVRVGAGGIRPRRALAHRRHRLRRAGRAVEPPALHGIAPRARPVGHRPVGRGQRRPRSRRSPTGAAASPPGSPRSTSWATWRWGAVTGDAADDLLREALATGEQMAELQRLSPPLWGLAEAARCRGDHGTALIAVRAWLPGLGRGHRRRLSVPVPAHRRAGPPGAWRR